MEFFLNDINVSKEILKVLYNNSVIHTVEERKFVKNIFAFLMESKTIVSANAEIGLAGETLETEKSQLKEKESKIREDFYNWIEENNNSIDIFKQEILNQFYATIKIGILTFWIKLRNFNKQKEIAQFHVGKIYFIVKDCKEYLQTIAENGGQISNALVPSPIIPTELKEIIAKAIEDAAGQINGLQNCIRKIEAKLDLLESFLTNPEESEGFWNILMTASDEY